MPSSGPRSILIAVDGSVHSKRAFKWYAQRLRKEEDQVVFIHVHESPISPPPTFANCATIPPREEWEQMHKKAEQRARDILANYETESTDIGLPFKTILAYGAIGPAICSAAKEEKADCVILGPRGLGTVRRTILGSVCDYVTQHSNTPVLMVPN